MLSSILKPWLAIFFLCCILSEPLQSETKRHPVDSKKRTPNAVSVNSEHAKYSLNAELLGSILGIGVLGSWNFYPRLFLNVGIGWDAIIKTQTSIISGTVKETSNLIIVPITTSYVIGDLEQNHFLEFLGGVAVNLPSKEFSGSQRETLLTQKKLIPQLGVGYRYWRVAGGFHFRGTVHVVFLGPLIYPWPGLTLGYSF